ncbi:hypothetical protein JGA16_000232 [Salmonella enterica]|nr:hypothetical protein [Salmonella enterica]
MFPAPAGINRALTAWIILYISVPRASGDKPDIIDILTESGECSPRQRG